MSTLATTGGTLNFRRLGGVGSINVILQNVADASQQQSATTDSTGTFTATLPSGTYNVIATNPANSNEKCKQPSRNHKIPSTNIGDLTLVAANLYNFKSELSDTSSAPYVDSDWLYFGTLAGQHCLPTRRV